MKIFGLGVLFAGVVADWQPPQAIGAPPLLPPGISLPTKGRSMHAQSGFRPSANSPAGANPAFTPPVAIGAPPILPPGVRINHGQSMIDGGRPPVPNHRPPPARGNSGWQPPVAIGAPPLLPPGISLPNNGGSMMRKIVPKKQDKIETVPPTPTGKPVEEPTKKTPTAVATVPHKDHDHHEKTEKLETTARPKLQDEKLESSSTKTIINAVCMATGLILLL